MDLSRISSHYAGMLKAHSMNEAQSFACEAMMTMATKIANLEKQIKELEAKLSRAADDASYAASMTRPIGSSHP